MVSNRGDRANRWLGVAGVADPGSGGVAESRKDRLKSATAAQTAAGSRLLSSGGCGAGGTAGARTSFGAASIAGGRSAATFGLIIAAGATAALATTTAAPLAFLRAQGVFKGTAGIHFGGTAV